NHASFDGSNKIYYPTLARAPTTEMTLSFWLRTTTTTETVLVSYRRTDEDSSGGQFVLKMLANGMLSYTEKIGDVEATVASGHSLWYDDVCTYNTGKWVHVTLVKRGYNVKIFCYGDQVAGFEPSLPNVPSATYTNAGFSVGADVDGSQGLVGEMSNLVIYLRAFDNFQDSNYDVNLLQWNTAKLSCHLNTSPVCDYDWCCGTLMLQDDDIFPYFPISSPESMWYHACTSCPNFSIPNYPEQCQP
ncbi:hypothetical protein EON64_21175, partial [archaeon]